MRKTIVRELGMQLPVGVLKDGKLDKSFVLRPYKSKVDRFLNIYREANEGRTMAHLAAKFLSLIVESAGGVSYPLAESGDSTADSEFKIYNWYFADVLYVYLYSRILNVSEMIEVPYRCQRCGTKGISKADLWTTEVKVVEKVDELSTWVDLKDGFKLENGKTCKKLKLQPVKYQAMFAAGSGGSSTGGLSYAQLRESVSEVDGTPPGYIIKDSEIDDIGKMDMLRIDRQAAIVSAGPDMRTSIDCPKADCGVQIKDALNWAFDPFFDSSVPLVALKR